MVLLLVFGSIIAFTSAQRPSYAGFNPVVTPRLASRFKDISTTVQTLTPSVDPINSRNGGEINQWSLQNQPLWPINNEVIVRPRKASVQGKTTGKGEVQGQQTESRNAIPHDRQLLNKLQPTRMPKHQAFRKIDHPMEFVQFFPLKRPFEEEFMDRMPPFFLKPF